jgi:hypothetical protein
MLKKRPRFEVKVRTDNELRWSSYFYCGLYELIAEGLVKISFEPKLAFIPIESYATLFKVVDVVKERKKMVVIDWRDNPDMLCIKKLTACDVYYKRNFIPERTFSVCPQDLQHKIRPAGLSYPLRTYRERPFWVRLIGAWYRHENIRYSPTVLFKALRHIPWYSRMPLGWLTEKEFKHETSEGIEPIILFQTMAYNPKSSAFPEDTGAVTEERAEVIRVLRRDFKGQVIAGFVPSDYVLQKYPDLVLYDNIDQHSYLGLVKRCRIAIYTRGLRDSPAFKMPEYLAAGRCIVSDPIKTMLPKPLVHGEHLLYFRSTEELVQQCKLILQDKALQRKLSQGALRYYEEEVRPKARVLKMLEIEPN